MATLELAPGLRLGIDLIDQQHVQFYDLMDRMIAADVGGDNRELVAGVIDELSDYVHGHFRTEEELMAEYGYPDLEAHRQQHAIFMTKVMEFHRKFRRQEIGLEDEVMSYLVDWFTEHVRTEDPKYVELFKANGL